MFRKLAGLTALAGLLFAGSASAQITGSRHDLQAELGITEICVVCHAPHNNQNANGEMLWNHADATTASYATYTSPTLDPGASPGQPGPTSLLCLGCHDGTTAVDNYGGVTTPTRFIDDAVFTTGQQRFGRELGNDHPIGLTYVPGAANEMHPLTEPVTFGVGSGTVADMLFGASNLVECASCHDVHAQQSGANSKLLRVTNAASQICLECHIK